MRRHDRHSSALGFMDYLFNLVNVFILLFVMALMMVKIEETHSKASIVDKNEFVITARWDDGTDDDVDLWVLDPKENSIGYFRREADGMFLQRDDLGRVAKKVTLPDGTVKEDLMNQEVADIRTFRPGQYTVNLHYYRPDAQRQAGVTVHVKLIKVNPYQEFPEETVVFTHSEVGIEKTAMNFTLDEQGQVLRVTRLPISFLLNAANFNPDTSPSPDPGVEQR